MFHDIGKIAVPESILDKNGALTDQELALIRTHPAAGAKILEPIRAYSKIIPMVAQHHEHFNGKGYPLGIAGNAISLGARILAVADVYDALLSDRPYRRGWPKSRVLAYMTEQAGAQFDPVVVEAFLSLMAEERPVLSSDVPGQGIVEVVNS
jgi:HD-GYP domain-containing protein (c-di-GMP phosphodiesterase class II)